MHYNPLLGHCYPRHKRKWMFSKQCRDQHEKQNKKGARKKIQKCLARAALGFLPTALSDGLKALHGTQQGAPPQPLVPHRRAHLQLTITFLLTESQLPKSEKEGPWPNHAQVIASGDPAPSYQISYGQDVLELWCHGMMLHCHKQRIQNNADGDG